MVAVPQGRLHGQGGKLLAGGRSQPLGYCLLGVESRVLYLHCVKEDIKKRSGPETTFPFIHPSAGTSHMSLQPFQQDPLHQVGVPILQAGPNEALASVSGLAGQMSIADAVLWMHKEE